MNLYLPLGIITFVIWSTFSCWYYVCQINGFCTESEGKEVAVASMQPIESHLNVDESYSEEDTSVEIQSVVEDPYSFAKDSIGVEITKNDILFLLDSDKLVDPETIEGFLDSVKNEVNDLSLTVKLVGHTCNRGSTAHNQHLGNQRALRVKDMIDQKSFNVSKIEVSSNGESSPLNNNTNEKDRTLNRRVELTIKH